MTYNITQLQDSSTISGLFVTANDYTGGILLSLFVLAVFFIMLMALQRWEFDDALLSSNFVCFLISAILVSVELLNLLWALGFLVLMAFTAFYMFLAK
jgi:hypothetical protein